MLKIRKSVRKLRVGDLVKYIPSPSASFKWEKYTDSFKSLPGIVISEVESKGTHTRRLRIRWNDGQISEEWITYLELYQ